METCHKKSTCINRDKSCFKCYGESLYKEVKQKTVSNKKFKKEDSWKQLEEDVSTDLNKIKSSYEAKRQIRSGALWFAPGDVDDPLVFLECKERKPTESKGTKSFTISKNWLDKAEEEAKSTDKPMFLPFRFKDDNDTYVVTKWESISEIITTVKSLMIELDRIEKEKKNAD